MNTTEPLSHADYMRKQAAEYRSRADDIAARCGVACTRDWSDLAEGWKRLAEEWERLILEVYP